jgi:hypothetical protein
MHKTAPHRHLHTNTKKSRHTDFTTVIGIKFKYALYSLKHCHIDQNQTAKTAARESHSNAYSARVEFAHEEGGKHSFNLPQCTGLTWKESKRGDGDEQFAIVHGAAAKAGGKRDLS